ncbi:MAG: hypothetical protein GXP49_15150 [Deltaproteobacteria bacterium]|nr:hypothetical protein [Deltaproteobacteria bacterium]
MKAYILKTKTSIPPFMDDVSEAYFVHETLAQAQDRALRKYGFEPVRIEKSTEINDDDYLLIFDWVYFSERAVRMFKRVLKRSDPGTKVLALTKSLSTQQPSALQGVVEEVSPDGEEIFLYDFYYVKGTKLVQGGPGEIRDALLADAERLVVPKREGRLRLRRPSVDAGQSQTQSFIELPITSTVVMHVKSWVHILWLNSLALGIHWMETIREHRGWMTGVVLRSFPWRSRYKFLKRMVRKGSNCKIHPSAYLEGCILGDNVEVGANATVRFSFVGDNAVISDGAGITNSVIGQGAFIREKSVVVGSVIYPEATIDNLKLQVSMVGKRSFMTFWFNFIDAKFEGDIMVDVAGGERGPVDTHFLGSCVGHDVVLMGKTLVHPGRAIPNGYKVVMRPDEAISEIPRDLPERTPLMRDERGKLVVFPSSN